MNKALIALGIFLLIGAFIIKEQSPDKQSFLSGVWDWIKELFGNVQDISGHAVSDYTWLPETNASRNISNSSAEEKPG